MSRPPAVCRIWIQLSFCLARPSHRRKAQYMFWEQATGRLIMIGKCWEERCPCTVFGTYMKMWMKPITSAEEWEYKSLTLFGIRWRQYSHLENESIALLLFDVLSENRHVNRAIFFLAKNINQGLHKHTWCGNAKNVSHIQLQDLCGLFEDYFPHCSLNFLQFSTTMGVTILPNRRRGQFVLEFACVNLNEDCISHNHLFCKFF